MQHPILSAAESRRARRELGLSQHKVASKSGLSRTKISWLEGESLTPDDKFVEALRRFYEEQGVEFSDEELAREQTEAKGRERDGGGASKPEREAGAAGDGNGGSGAGAESGDGGEKEADEVSRKRRERSEPSGERRQSARRNGYRGGLTIDPEMDDASVESLMVKIEENDERIAQLVEQEAGEGVAEGGFLIGSGDLELSGEDREKADELVRRVAANYVLVRLLQGRAVVAPCEDETVRKPWNAEDHGELLSAQVLPYVCGPVPEKPEEDEGEGRNGKRAKLPGKASQDADVRRERMRAVQ